MATVPDLVATAQTLIEMGPNEIVFDFSRLSFIDGTGLAGMVELQERLGNQGRHLAVRSANGNARRLFEITELTEFLRVES
jgi:anti-anti-sigma factor